MPKSEERIDLVGQKKKNSTSKPQLSDFIINVAKKGESRLDIIPSTLSLIEIENSERGAEHHYVAGLSMLWQPQIYRSDTS